MPETYEKVKGKVTDLLAKCEWLSCTTDVWTNPSKTCSLLSLTGHFIVESQRLKVILGAAVLKNDHTGEYVGEKLIEMIHEWNISYKLFLIMRDNAPNMICHAWAI